MINGRIICTVNTDASFNSQRDTGGYAIWIRCDEVVVKYWGDNFKVKFLTQMNVK